MADITALLATRDCAAHACAKEADGPDGLCSEHRAYQEPDEALIPGIWCPTCKQKTHPHDRTGRCLWCDTQLEPASGSSPSLEVAKPEEPDPDLEEPPMRTCEEAPGCTNPTVSDRGPYARVCADHKHLVTERLRASGQRLGNERAAAPKPRAKVKARPETNGEAPPGSLAKLAAQVDVARYELTQAREAHETAVAALVEALDAEVA